MRVFWILSFSVSSCLSLVAADDNIPTLNTTGLSSCAVCTTILLHLVLFLTLANQIKLQKSCLTTYTQCALNDTLCICYAAQPTRTIQGCLVQNCSLADGMQFEDSIKASCPSYVAPSQQRFVLNVTLSFSVIAVLLAMLRIPFHIYEKQKVFAEDWLLLVAVASQTALVTLISLAAYNGLGEHVLDVDPVILRQGLIYMYSATPVYWLVILTTRLSVVLFLRRVNPSQSYRSCTMAMIAFIMLWGILVISLSISQCQPISYNWDMVLQRNSPSNVTKGSCFNLDALAFASSAIGLFQDILIFLLAVPLLCILRLRIEKLFGPCLALLVGLFLCIAAAIRLGSLVTFRRNTLDPTWANTQEIIWSAIETSTGIILSSLPILSNIITKMARGSLDFPDNFFKRSNEDGTTTRWGNWQSADYLAGLNQSPDSSSDSTIERKFEIRRTDRSANAETRSIRSMNSLKRLAHTLNSNRPESTLTNNTDARDHLNRTYGEHNRHSNNPRPPSAVAKVRSKRLASPTQGIFHDTLWRKSLETPRLQKSNEPLSSLPTNEQQPPPRSQPPSRTSQASISSTVHSRNSEALTRIPEIGTAPPSRSNSTSFPYNNNLTRLPYSDSTQSTITEVMENNVMSENNNINNSNSNSNSSHPHHTPNPEEPRPLPKPPLASLRNPPQASSQPMKSSPKTQQLSLVPMITTGPVHRQVIPEHQDENLLGIREEVDGEGEGGEHKTWLVPTEWARGRSRIKRTSSGRAIEFNWAS